jgi:SEC-C motif
MGEGSHMATPTATERTERLLASYDLAGGINHVDGRNLPSKRAIAGITSDLLRLLFPGFFDETPIRQGLTPANVMPWTRLLDAARSQSVQIGRNDLCPGGSGRKFRRCCLERSALAP